MYERMAHRKLDDDEQPKSTTPWLAISFGCCASRSDVEEDSAAALRANGETEMMICYDQPQPVSRPQANPLSARPTTSHSMGRHVSQWVASGRDFATRASSRASVHTLSKPRRSQSRPRIGQPMNFRHHDGYDSGDGVVQSMLDDAPMPVRRRRSFRPLELSIYVDPDNRLSDLPDFLSVQWDKALSSGVEPPGRAMVRDRDSRTNSLTSSPDPSSYLIQRKPIGSGSRRSSVQSQTELLQRRPIGSASRRSSVQSQTEMIQLSGSASGSLPFLYDEPRSRRDSLSSNSNTLVRSGTQGSNLSSPRRIVSRLPSPNRSRSNTDSSIPRGSLRRARTDVDEAIRELNTIVEERRADAYRSNNQVPALINRIPLSPSHHVPLIAPSLRMHVRSETLSDIGSAFSVPLASKPLPAPPAIPPPFPSFSTSLSRAPTKLSVRPPSRQNTLGPLTSNPITPPTPTQPSMPTTPSSAISRLGAWIKRSLPSTPTTPYFSKSGASTPKHTPRTPSEPFYHCDVQVPIPPAYMPVSNGTLRSRPSTAGSRTLAHTRQDSDQTATVTLLSQSSYPSTPSLSLHSSPSLPTYSPPETAPSSPEPRPAVVAASSAAAAAIARRSSPPPLLKGEAKMRKIPAPLTLYKGSGSHEDLVVEKPLGSARSVSSLRSLKPPPSPHYGLLKGMEISVRPVEDGLGRGIGGMMADGAFSSATAPGPVTPVGVAF